MSEVPSEVRIKNVEVIRDEGMPIEDTMLRITIDADGEEYSFVIDLWTALDDNEIIETLKHWKNRVIPRKRKIKTFTDKDITQIVERLKMFKV